MEGKGLAKQMLIAITPDGKPCNDECEISIILIATPL